MTEHAVAGLKANEGAVNTKGRRTLEHRVLRLRSFVAALRMTA